jgi:hypothetical protein
MTDKESDAITEKNKNLLKEGWSIIISHEAYQDKIYDNDADYNLVELSRDPNTLARRVVWSPKGGGFSHTFEKLSEVVRRVK